MPAGPLVRCALVSLALLAAAATAPARACIEPAQERLVRFLEAHGQQSGLPQGEAAVAIRPWLSRELNAAIDAARVEQARVAEEYPDEKPPWIEGPLFNSSGYEPYTAFQVRQTGDCDGGRCVFRVDYTDASVSPAITWHDEYVMVAEQAQWRLDDVEFRAGCDFCQSGRLRANLEVGTPED